MTDKELSDKEAVLAVYPRAFVWKTALGEYAIFMSPPATEGIRISNWSSTEAEAWADARSRLAGSPSAPEPPEDLVERCSTCGGTRHRYCEPVATLEDQHGQQEKEAHQPPTSTTAKGQDEEQVCGSGSLAPKAERKEDSRETLAEPSSLAPEPPCEYCGPVCYKGAEHNARVEDGAKYVPKSPESEAEKLCPVCKQPVEWPKWEKGKTGRTAKCRHMVQTRSAPEPERGELPPLELTEDERKRAEGVSKGIMSCGWPEGTVEAYVLNLYARERQLRVANAQILHLTGQISVLQKVVQEVQGETEELRKKLQRFQGVCDAYGQFSNGD